MPQVFRKGFQGLRVGLSGGLLTAMIAYAGLANAAPAQVPLFLGSKAIPNVVYTMDESWSMSWRYMPDEITFAEGTIYGNPWATGAADSGDSNGHRWGLSFHPNDVTACSSCNATWTGNDPFVARADTDGLATDLLSARLRSAAFNTIYYNPQVRYRPWYNSNGTSFTDADPAAAPLNPNSPTSTRLDLRGEVTFSSATRWCHSASASTANTTLTADKNRTTPTCGNITGEKLAPAVWYEYIDGAPRGTDGKPTYAGLNEASNFRRVQIKDFSSFTRGPERTDCAEIAAGSGTSCTQAEEYKNFANWFTYNRTRMFLAIAATSRAFSEQGSGLRVGYGRIHQPQLDLDGKAGQGTVERGVRIFDGSDRDAFFTWLHKLGGKLQVTGSPQLYGVLATDHRFEGGTPLRQAMDDVGQYYSWADNRGPWGNTPGTNDATTQLSCRKAYHILMTDGMWTNTSARTSGATENVDNTDGLTISRSVGASYKYTPVYPYKDEASGTLADVAMYYWKNDLRPGIGGLANMLSPDNENPAFWQNMVNFTVGLGVKGGLDFPGDLDALTAGTKTWPSPVTPNTSRAVDDLWHAAVNSRGKYFSATNPDQFSKSLSDILESVSGREESSSSSIAANSTRLDNGTIIYQARFNSRDWSGQLRAFKPSQATGQINEDAPFWDTNSTLVRSSTRNIFTASGVTGSTITTGVNFNWSETGFTTAMKTLLKAGGVNDTVGQSRLNWLRGSAANEGTSVSSLRVRTRLLGDIANSDPFFVGKVENYGYQLLPSTEGSSYATFLANTLADTIPGKSNRTDMIYVGANDGMLHGFDATTGAEVFAYIPAGVFGNLHELTSNAYQHRFFVDGSPRAGDAYINSTWKTVLLGSTGAGGKSVFALDVTNPSAMGAGKLMWEFSTSATSTDKLGYAMSQPIIARVKAGGKWVAIFSNGYESGDTQKLMVVDLASGSLIKAITTGAGSGLASVVPVDIDADRVTDYVYAGDLNGDVWRFDLTANSSNSWSVSKLFHAVDEDDVSQPITSRLEVGRHPAGGLFIYFGTGKYFETNDNVVGSTPQVQSFYGIRDLNGALVTRANLQQQTIIYEGVGALTETTSTEDKVRVVSSTQDTPTHGWYMNLIPPSPASAEGERSVSTPILRSGRIIFTTIIPNSDPCGFGGSGWLMELDALTGGRLAYSALDMNNDGIVDENDYVRITVGDEVIRVPVSGKGSDEMIKTPGIVEAGELEYKYTSGSSGSIEVTTESGDGNVMGRQSWRQLQ